MRAVFLALIRAYQRILSPVTGQNCRFHPSCSQYGYEAIGRHGVMRGSWLLLKRLGKCHPWHPGGIDEVPREGSRQAHG